MLKECKNCRQILPIDRFYIHAKMKDGHLSFCRGCVCLRVSKHRQHNIIRIREYDRSRANQPNRKAVNKKTMARFRKNKPQVYAALCYVQNAIRAGLIKRESCCVCGKNPTDAVHKDTSKPSNVTWLCRDHRHQFRRGKILLSLSLI